MADIVKRNNNLRDATDLGRLIFPENQTVDQQSEAKIVSDTVGFPPINFNTISRDTVDYFTLTPQGVDKVTVEFSVKATGNYANLFYFLPSQGVSEVDGAGIWTGYGGVHENTRGGPSVFREAVDEHAELNLHALQNGEITATTARFVGSTWSKDSNTVAQATWTLDGSPVVFQAFGLQFDGDAGLDDAGLENLNEVSYDFKIIPSAGTFLDLPPENLSFSSPLYSEQLFVGGDGIDTVRFRGKADQHTVLMHKDGMIEVVDRWHSDSTDSLVDIELLDFRTGSDIDLQLFSGVVENSVGDLETLIEMYIAYFDRAPDAEGLYYWGNRLSEGMQLNEIAQSFFVQPETTAIYPNDADVSVLVTSVYNNLFGREPDEEGLAYWTTELGDGSVQRAEFILAVINGAKASTGSPADAKYIEGKADIGTYYSVIKGLRDTTDAANVMDLYDGSQDSLIRAKDQIDDYYDVAEAGFTGSFLFQLVGVLENPFQEVA